MTRHATSTPSRTGGRYDGNLGVLAGLEVVETLDAPGVEPARPLAVAFFTDEEGARFAPDMLGSLVYVGGHAARGGARHRRHRRRRARRRAGPHRLRRRRAVPGPGRRTPSSSCTSSRARCSRPRASPSARSPACRASRGRSSPSPASRTTPAPRRCDLRHDAGYVAAAIATFVRELAARARRPPGRHRRPHRAAPEPGQRGRRPRPRSPSTCATPTSAVLQPRPSARLADVRRRAGRGRGRRRSTAARLARFEPVDVRRPASSTSSRRRRRGSATRCGACRRAPATTPRCWPGCARPGWSSCRASSGISHNPAEHTDADRPRGRRQRAARRAAASWPRRERRPPERR